MVCPMFPTLPASPQVQDCLSLLALHHEPTLLHSYIPGNCQAVLIDKLLAWFRSATTFPRSSLSGPLPPP